MFHIKSGTQRLLCVCPMNTKPIKKNLNFVMLYATNNNKNLNGINSKGEKKIVI